jgi:hypothetical protein
MSDTTGSPVARALVIGLLAVATLGFGLAGLCGAAFTAVALPDVFTPRANNYAGAALVFSVPSLLIGAPLAWVCGRALRKRLRRDP